MRNDTATGTATFAAVHPGGKLAYATPANAPMVEGRRSFLKYQDLGVSTASSGRMRAQVMSATAGMTKPTGWHYHVCDGQFVRAQGLGGSRVRGRGDDPAPGG